MYYRNRDYYKVTLSKKIMICLMLMAFGAIVLIFTSTGGESSSDTRMRALISRGQKAVGKLTGVRPHGEGPQGPHEHLTYTFNAGGRAYAYEEAWYRDQQGEPPKEQSLTYLPEDPRQVARVLHEPYQRDPSIDFVPWVFVAVGGLFLVITLLRIPANREAEMQELRDVERVEREGVDAGVNRVFHYRIGWWLPVFAFMLAVPSILIFVFLKAIINNEIISFNDVPTPAGEVWWIAIPLVLGGGLFVVIAIAGLLSFFNERIVWGNGQIVWHDRWGRERVRAPLSSILGVRYTNLYVNHNVRVSIDTVHGEIRFLDSMDWAETLENLAAAVAVDNDRRT